MRSAHTLETSTIHFTHKTTNSIIWLTRFARWACLLHLSRRRRFLQILPTDCATLPIDVDSLYLYLKIIPIAWIAYTLAKRWTSGLAVRFGGGMERWKGRCLAILCHQDPSWVIPWNTRSISKLGPIDLSLSVPLQNILNAATPPHIESFKSSSWNISVSKDWFHSCVAVLVLVRLTFVTSSRSRFCPFLVQFGIITTVLQHRLSVALVVSKKFILWMTDLKCFLVFFRVYNYSSLGINVVSKGIVRSLHTIVEIEFSGVRPPMVIWGYKCKLSFRCYVSNKRVDDCTWYFLSILLQRTINEKIIKRDAVLLKVPYRHCQHYERNKTGPPLMTTCIESKIRKVVRYRLLPTTILSITCPSHVSVDDSRISVIESHNL